MTTKPKIGDTVIFFRKDREAKGIGGRDAICTVMDIEADKNGAMTIFVVDVNYCGIRMGVRRMTDIFGDMVEVIG